jgi:CTP-dependent riboflavin kinase
MPTVTGIVRAGGKHWSRLRPGFYAEVERMLGVRLHQGTINVELSQEAFAKLYHHPWLVVPGSDQIDIDDNQNIGLIPCHVEGVLGVRVIPFNRQTGSLGGYQNTVEICLTKELPAELVRTDGELDVAFL